jgi:hypothetical protein
MSNRKTKDTPPPVPLGGLRRRQAIDDIVDEAVTGKKKGKPKEEPKEPPRRW